MASDAQARSFIAMIAPIAVAQAAMHGWKVFPSVCIAQACCESAYGTAPKMQRANAVFGIKVGNSKWHYGTAWKDKAYSTTTKECYDGKTYTNIVDMFRAYDSIEEATEDYYDMICTASRYKHALNQPNPRACIEGIQKAPYATAPGYVQTIMSIINKYNLVMYDMDAKRQEQAEKKTGNPYDEPVATIRLNMKGNGVRWVQYQLNLYGYKLVVDGIAGNLTIGAVLDFQSKNGLKADGLVGPQTRLKLAER